MTEAAESGIDPHTFVRSLHGNRYQVIEDPDGNPIELFQPAR